MKQMKVDLASCTATVKELTVRDVKNIMSNIKELVSGDDIQVQDILTDKLDSILDVAGNLVHLSGKKEILDLSFSEIQELIPVIIEVNSAFFGQLAALGILPVPQLAEEPLAEE